MLRSPRAIGLSTFCAVFALLAWHRGFSAPATLDLTGRFERPVHALVRWDSGHGFSPLATVPVVLGTRPLELKPHRLELERLGVHQAASLDSEVWVEAIEFGEGPPAATFRAVSLADQVTDGAVLVNGRLCSTADHHRVVTAADFSRARLRFLTHPGSGTVRVWLDGAVWGDFDLYSATPQSLTIELDTASDPGMSTAHVPLPQVELAVLEVVAGEPFVLDEARVGGVALPRSSEPKAAWTFEVPSGSRRALHPVLLGVQLAVAALVALGVTALFAARRRRASWADLARDWVVREQRWQFWALYGVSSSCFGFWVLGQWPAAMSIDSGMAWVELRTLEFTDFQPLAFKLYVLSLLQLCDSPAIVAVFQALAMAALGSAAFFQALRRGANRVVVLGCFALFCTSVPIGLFNTVMWKDVPFTLLLICWALFLVFARQHRPLELRPWARFGLAVSFVSLCTLRHNGLVFLAIVPLLVGGARLFSRRELVRFLATSALLFIGYQGAVVGLGIKERSHAPVLDAVWQLGPVAALAATPEEPEAFLEQQRLLSPFLEPAALAGLYSPGIAYAIHDPALRFNFELTAEQAHALRSFYVQRVLAHPLRWATDRSLMLASTLGVTKPLGLAFANDLTPEAGFFPPSMPAALVPRGARLELAELMASAYGPPWPALTALQGRLMTLAMEWPTGRLFFWSTLAATLFVMTWALRWRRHPGTALASMLVLSQLPFLFVTLPSSEVRYVYFLGVFALLVWPLALAERAAALAVTAPAGASTTGASGRG